AFRLATGAATSEAAAAETLGVHFVATVSGDVAPARLRGFIPVATVREAFSPRGPASAPETRRRLEAALQKIPVTVSVVLGRAGIDVEQIAALEPGDVIALDRGPSDPCELRVSDAPMLLGKLGVKGARLALKVTGLCPTKGARPAVGAAK